MEGLFALSILAELVGTIAFAISGSMIAVEKELDLFGTLMLGLITALGGGVLRDLILGRFPPSNFYNYGGVIASLVSASVVFLFAYLNQAYYFSHRGRISMINNVIDSLGLGLFSVTGVHATILAGYGDNVFLVLFMGMLTGVGGGLLRDLITMQIPIIIKKNIYAVASLVGSLSYLIMLRQKLDDRPAAFLSVLLVVLIRMCATKWHWNLPRIRWRQD